MPTGHVEIKHAIGSALWYAGPQWRRHVEPCPDCMGAKIIGMTCGDGSTHLLACGNCARGFDPPCGYVERTVCEYVPTKVEVRGVEVERDGRERYDVGVTSRADPADLFEDLVACERACSAKHDAAQAEEDARMLHCIAGNRRSKAHSVSYWRQQARRLREELARVESYLQQRIKG